MFERFKNFIKKGQEPESIVLYRRGYPIFIQVKHSEMLKKKKQYISLVLAKGKPACVQVTTVVNGKNTYVSSLKKMLGVKSFVNGNVCDFRKSNII